MLEGTGLQRREVELSGGAYGIGVAVSAAWTTAMVRDAAFGKREKSSNAESHTGRGLEKELNFYPEMTYFGSGVASYGALEHVPSCTSNDFIFFSLLWSKSPTIQIV